MDSKKNVLVHDLMRKAIRLAGEGLQRVSPNPRTGAVIVRNNRVIGKGRHEYFGGPHAEVNAIRDAENGTKDAEMYVTLEPCCHTGKTPPCTDAIIRAGIRKVYVGMRDPNPLVAGKGIAALRQAGIEVIDNILPDACSDLNQPFIKKMTQGFPYVIVKAAITLDGYIADEQQQSKWISSDTSRKKVHEMRAAADAVLVGIGTVLADDPELTVRDTEGDNPMRIVFDPEGVLPVTSRLVRGAGEIPLCVITRPSASDAWKIRMEKNKVELIIANDAVSGGLTEGLRQLGEREVQSVLAEGGGKLHGLLAKQGVIDRLELFIAPKLLGEGVRMMKIPPRLMPDPAVFLSHSWQQSERICILRV
ncbi:MAG: bifunctional diaminohydroxyphosphoribosylaminopyrimidine deaminase/5-amino-6-(5-phosphoribosylamino)uracil reductase RibD [Candidatus Marinimicrobia bacterium]|nr:bifunctional diaminohydroxyphosphoribosylaminopyrimidine deaminase/5-amino-6-(5-phosphoribosylamino)uracil reductase RibD [Candidatus Neomarinimicrobiota bacterium]